MERRAQHAPGWPLTGRSTRVAALAACLGLAALCGSSPADAGTPRETSLSDDDEAFELRRCRLALDISSTCLEVTFSKSVQEAEAASERILAELNRVWIPEAGIRFELGALTVRDDPETDPYLATRDAGALMGISRRENAKHRCDVIMALCANASQGGGLGGGRAVWVAWGGDAWDLMHHEFSHAFGTSHGHGWPFERGTMNSSEGSRYPRTRFNTLNTVELGIIRDNARDLPVIKPAPANSSPYARFDEIHLPRDARLSKVRGGARKARLDVLENDLDVDGHELRIASVDAKSARGAQLKVVDGKTIEYVMDDAFSGYWDHDTFAYEIEDASGARSCGGAAVLFDDAKRLLRNGSFADGERRWAFEGAKVVPNGEAITSVQVDQRVLLETGDSISQKVRLNRKLSASYDLELSMFCGTERGADGGQVPPSGDPELIIHVEGGGLDLAFPARERDEFLALPIDLEKASATYEIRFENVGGPPVRIGDIALIPIHDDD